MGIKYHAAAEFTEHANGSRVHYTPGAFASVAKVTNCPCEDGKRRTVYASAEPDTFFSIPALTRVREEGKQRTVAGFLTTDENGWKFIAYSYGKNAALLKSVDTTTGITSKTTEVTS